MQCQRLFHPPRTPLVKTTRLLRGRGIPQKVSRDAISQRPKCIDLHYSSRGAGRLAQTFLLKISQMENENKGPAEENHKAALEKTAASK